jgi:opacity protein-like surface antigen
MRHLSAGVVVLGLSVGVASAADMPVKAVVLSKAPVAAQTGLYAVVGGSVAFEGGSATLNERNCNSAVFIPCNVPANMKSEGGWGIFGGIGYRFVRWFRGEVRVGYGEASARGTTAFPGEFTNVTADFNTSSVMFNGYVDFAGFATPGFFGIFEPYVGAGVGAARNRAKNIRFVSGPLGGAPFADAPYTVPGGTHTDLAYNVSVGTGVRLTQLGLPNWLFDIAYRYRDFGISRTAPGPVINIFGASIGNVQGFEVPARAHGVDFALRYEFVPMPP